MDLLCGDDGFGRCKWTQNSTGLSLFGAGKAHAITKVVAATTAPPDACVVNMDLEGFRESRRCSRDTYPESCITEYTLVYEDYGVVMMDLDDANIRKLRQGGFFCGPRKAPSLASQRSGRIQIVYSICK